MCRLAVQVRAIPIVVFSVRLLEPLNKFIANSTRLVDEVSQGFLRRLKCIEASRIYCLGQILADLKHDGTLDVLSCSPFEKAGNNLLILPDVFHESPPGALLGVARRLFG